MSYADFLARKAQNGTASGFDPTWLPDWLFPFQADLTRWAIRQGRGATFADCGLGKTPMQLVWARNVIEQTGKPALVITPLAVSFQTVGEAEKFGIDAAISRDGKVPAEITVTNYERLEHFDPAKFGGVVCDESSAIKAYDGQRRALVTEFLRTIPYRHLYTATAAPNDYVELGTSSEALAMLGHIDMLNRFFVNLQKTSDTKGRWKGHAAPRAWEGKQWRFKGHAELAFWRWVTSWARAVRRPSDLGYADDGFVLPDLDTRVHVVGSVVEHDDQLFSLPANGLREERAELRATISERCERAATVLADADSAVAWCHLNEESTRLTKLIDGAVELTGSASAEEKEEKLLGFSAGKYRVLVTKPSIGAWGMNWQHCHRMVYFPSHSYEQYYQAIRRSWRFGQQHPVTVDVITTEGGRNTLANLQRKAAAADRMFASLVEQMTNGLAVRSERPFTQEAQVPAWLRP